MARLGEYVQEETHPIGEVGGNGLSMIGVSNDRGLEVSSRSTSANIARYIEVRRDWFAYNPMRINIGSIGLADDDSKTGYTSPDYTVFSCKDGLLPEYLLRFLKSEYGLEAIARHSSGAVRKRLYFSGLSNIELEIPSIERQKVAIQRFQTIEQATRIIFKENSDRHELPQLKQAILQEAIQGKLTEDLPVRQAGWRDPKFLNLSGKRVPEKTTTHFAYVLECSDGSLYKGMCQNLWERIDRHLNERGSEWTAKNKPVALIHFEEFETLAEARTKETYFKSGSGREWLKKIHLERRVSYEPASQLLKRIQAEKARLADLPAGKAGKKLRPVRRAGGKEKPLPKITPEEIPFKIPKGWEWCKLGSVIGDTDSGWSPACLKHEASSGKWGVLKTTAVQIREYLEHENKELPPTLTPRTEAEARIGDILMTRAGPANRVGICCLVRATRPLLMISDKLVRFRPVLANPEYIELFAATPQFQQLIEASKQGMAQSQVNISRANLTATLMPLPPLAEQAAIVERVEALMTTCRALETEIEQSRTHAAHLLQAVIKEAFAPSTSDF